MKTIEIKPEKLFRIFLENKNRKGYDYNFLVNQKSLDYYNKWWNGYTITIEEELEPVTFDGVTIETEGSKKVGRCYHVCDYIVKSEKPLDDFSLDVLRAYGVFKEAAGQREGYLVSKEEKEGLYIYNLRSEVDSSD